MNIEIPNDVQYILNQLHQHGYNAYIVGGCVRDALLGKQPQDWDITTSALPNEIQQLFSNTVDTGIKHGTVRVILHHICYEVTTFRMDEEYMDHRHPKVTFTRNLKEDLKRRDFTINAMAYDEISGIIDEHHGQDDLNNQIIRCVGEPMLRFEEDALRMMRALRFAAQLNFTIEKNTQIAIQKQAHLLTKISAERIQEELLKLLCSNHPERVGQLYELGITSYIIPEFDRMMDTEQINPHHYLSVGEHTLSALTYVFNTPVLRLAMFFHDIGKPYAKTTDSNGIDHFRGHGEISTRLAKEIMQRLKFDRTTIQTVTHLIYWHDYRPEATPKAVRKAIHKIGEEYFPLFLKIQYADLMAQSNFQRENKLKRLSQVESIFQEIIQNNHCLSISDLALSGKDLLEMGMVQGPAIGNCLQYLLEQVLENPTWNTTHKLQELAQSWLSNQ